MIRLVVNALLGIGYVLGMLLVWIGIEMYAVDGARLAPSLFSVSLGVAVWGVLSTIGRMLRSRVFMHGMADVNSAQTPWGRP